MESDSDQSSNVTSGVLSPSSEMSSASMSMLRDLEDYSEFIQENHDHLEAQEFEEISTTVESEDYSDGEEEDLNDSEDMFVENGRIESDNEELAGYDYHPLPATPMNWDWSNVTAHKSHPIPFDAIDSGWNFLRDPTMTELQSFQMTFPGAALNHCVEESNRFAHNVIEETLTNKGSVSRRMSTFKEIEKSEFIKLLAIRMLMGISKKPEQENYWSTNPLLKCDIIPKILSSDRYFEIMRYLHFSNNNEQIPEDRIAKIRPIWDLCVKNFKTKLRPFRNICVDESLILFKGRLFFKQYNPMKRSRFGIKTFSLVDCETGYILDSIIYSGKGHQFCYSTKDLGYGGAVVLDLVSDYLGKGHCIFMDIWFSSPTLAHELLQMNTYICGTVQKRRKEMPKPDKMKKGDLLAFKSGEVLVEYWKDRKIVSMISTSHDLGTTEVTLRNQNAKKIKPNTVLEYNAYAGAIDQSDMLMKYYSIMRRSLKWYKKLYFHLVDVCIFNGYKIFVAQHSQTSFLKYRLALIEQMLQYTGLSCAKTTDSNRLNHLNHPLRLSLPGKHFPDANPARKGRKSGSKKCTVCISSDLKTAVNKWTSYQCNICKVPLCATPCFEIYHTKQVY